MENKLRDIVKDGRDKLNNLLSQIQKFNSNIVSSNAYFQKKRNKLEALMEEERMPTTWFILSAIDNHCADLNRIIHGDRPIPIFYN